MADTTSGPSQARIRTDLWRAVLDFSGDEKYVWDQDGLVARRTSEARDPGPDMPTITPEQFTGWKKRVRRERRRQPTGTNGSTSGRSGACRPASCRPT